LDPTPAPYVPGPLLTQVLVAVLCLVWGSTWLVIQEGLVDLPPLTSAGLRFAIAFAVMCLVAPRLARREGGTRPPVRLWVVVGSLNFGVSYAIVYLTETVLPSGIVSVLWAVFPLLMAVSGHYLLGERLRPVHWLGFGVGFVGVAMLFVTDLRQFGEAAVPAALLLFVSPLVSVVGQTCIKRWGTGSSSALLNRNAMGLGAVLLLLGAALFEQGAPARWTARAWLSIGYLALVGTCLTFSLYYWLLRFVRATRLSVIAFVTPVVALWLGWAFGGEPLTATTIGGAGLVVLGVALVVRVR
jgi:drug/metabolite transporter (DMT)-like permease